MVDVWTLRYPGCEFPFGSLRATGYGLTADPVVRPGAAAYDDAPLPRTDGVAFGQDFLGGTTVAFALLTDHPSADAPSALQDRFAAAWRADSIRRVGGATAELIAPSGRIAHGRPRRPEAEGRFLRLGRSRLSAEFDTVNADWYGEEQVLDVPFAPPTTGGGLLAPLAAPLTTTRESDRSKTLVVGGDLATPLVVTIQGPISRAVLRIGPILLELREPLAYDGLVVADGRPWRKSLRRNSAPAGAAFSPASTWLTELQLPPGRYDVSFRGLSESGGASASIRWADAFATY